jgi:hypothetical protein
MFSLTEPSCMSWAARAAAPRRGAQDHRAEIAAPCPSRSAGPQVAPSRSRQRESVLSISPHIRGANPDLLALWRGGHDRPPRPCTFSNTCLFNLLESPLGCYDQSRYSSREEMLREIYEVFEPPPFTDSVEAPERILPGRS